MESKNVIDIKNAEILNEGITNKSYLIDHKYVYRCKKEIIDPFNKPENEYEIILKIKNLITSEKVIDYNPHTGEKLSIFINDTSRINVSPSEQQLLLLKKAIDEFHSIKIGVNFKPFERLAFYKRYSIHKINNNFEKKIIANTKLLYEKYPCVFSHNDLVKGNLLFKNDRLFVLDYEYAGNNIELFDVASFISENELDDNAIKYFLSLFPYNDDEIYTMVMFENILWYYWAYFMYSKTKRTIFLTIADDKLNKLSNI